MIMIIPILVVIKSAAYQIYMGIRALLGSSSWSRILAAANHAADDLRVLLIRLEGFEPFNRK